MSFISLHFDTESQRLRRFIPSNRFFSSAQNPFLPRFYSKENSAFKHFWHSKNVWANPPWELLDLIMDEVKQTAQHWPLLHPCGLTTLGSKNFTIWLPPWTPLCSTTRSNYSYPATLTTRYTLADPDGLTQQPGLYQAFVIPFSIFCIFQNYNA